MNKTYFKQSAGSKTFDFLNVIVLALLGFITLFPLYYVFIISISSGIYVSRGDVAWIPKGINFDVYKLIFEYPNVLISYWNTIKYTIVGTAINLILSTLCAYPLSRKDFYGRNVFTFFIAVTLFFSGGLIPLFLVVLKLNMINTIWAIVLPGAISTYNMIIMRTFFQNIPISLQESAYLDGANDLQILLRIILPLSMPLMATMTLFYSVGHWNSYFPALIYLNERSKFPLQMILRNIVIQGDFAEVQNEVGTVAQVNVVAQNYKYAVIMVAVLPILAVYPFIQKYFVKGVMIGAIKG